MKTCRFDSVGGVFRNAFGWNKFENRGEVEVGTDTGLIEKNKVGKLTIVDLPEIFNLETALSGGYSRSGDLVLR
jgi:hypothetical protein